VLGVSFAKTRLGPCVVAREVVQGVGAGNSHQPGATIPLLRRGSRTRLLAARAFALHADE